MALGPGRSRPMEKSWGHVWRLARTSCGICAYVAAAHLLRPDRLPGLAPLALMPRVKPTEVEPDSKSVVTWEDIAGVDEAAAELQEVVDFLQHPRRFARLGARVPKGILLYGPPGTGKTLLAKAVAHASGANFYSQSASAFVEMFAGLGAARIRKLFEKARKNAPAIVFIDELDAVGMRRSGQRLQPRARPDSEPAPRRAGRLPQPRPRSSSSAPRTGSRTSTRRCFAPVASTARSSSRRPTSPAARRSSRVHTRGKPLAADVDLDAVARQTSGLTGADLANICNEAAIFAGRAERSTSATRDFDAAIERIVAGLQQRRVVTEKEKRILAYHEGGPRAHVAPRRRPAAGAEGDDRLPRARRSATRSTRRRRTATSTRRRSSSTCMKVMLARPRRGADRLRRGHERRRERPRARHRARPRDDLRVRHGRGGRLADDAGRQLRALRAHEAASATQEQARLTDHAYEEALRLLAKHRPTLDLLADALLEKETLLRAELEQLLAGVDAGVDASERRRDAAGRAPRRTAPDARPRRYDPAPWRFGASTTSRWPSRISTRRVDTYERLFGAEVELRGRMEEPGRRRRLPAGRRRAGRARLAARRGHARRALPRQARPGHAPRRVRGGRRTAAVDELPAAAPM